MNERFSTVVKTVEDEMFCVGDTVTVNERDLLVLTIERVRALEEGVLLVTGNGLVRGGKLT